MLHEDAKHAIASVIEEKCPLCQVELREHDGRAFCSCCGDRYKAQTNRLEIQRCSKHGRDCVHWQRAWQPRSSVG